MNVLLVEDDIVFANRICSLLLKDKEVSLVKLVHNFSDALDYGLSLAFDMILVDIQLGDKEFNGLDLCKSLRSKHPNIPIIVLTGVQSLQFLEQAFELGVTDYLFKPFHARELLARMKRWKTNICGIKVKALEYHDLRLCFTENKVFFKESPLILGRKSKILLRYFLESPEFLLSTSWLSQRLWGDENCETHNIRSNIQALRKSLSPFCADWIRTVHGEGYVLKK